MPKTNTPKYLLYFDNCLLTTTGSVVSEKRGFQHLEGIINNSLIIWFWYNMAQAMINDYL